MDGSAMAVREQNWLQTLQQASASGLSNKEWCRQNGVAVSTFYKWKHELRDRLLNQIENAAPSGVHFVKVPPLDGAAKNVGEIRIHSGNLFLEMPADLSEEALGKVLWAVRNAW